MPRLLDGLQSPSIPSSQTRGSPSSQPFPHQLGNYLFALDTEVTGVDHFHGAKPFMVTTCDLEGPPQFWQWEVDPLTRQPTIPPSDIRELRTMLLRVASWGRHSEEVADRHRIVGHNIKFDAHALDSIGLDVWPWSQTDDTIQMHHLLASNHLHNLTVVTKERLGVDILPLEGELHRACFKARNLCRSHLPEWMIAKEDLLCMPSAGGSKGEKDKTWKFDMWLPRAVCLWAQRQKKISPQWWWEYAEADHPWLTVCQEYSCCDSEVTVRAAVNMLEEIDSRGLKAIYREKIRNLPILFEMERRGVTYILPELLSMEARQEQDIKVASDKCLEIAATMREETLVGPRQCFLDLPKGSSNNASLTRFFFGALGMPVLAWTEGGESGNRKPSLTKDLLAEYKSMADLTDVQREFVSALASSRKKAKSQDFLAAYRKHGLPVGGTDYCVLHPSLNATATATTRLSCTNPNLQQVSKVEIECEACLGEGCEVCGGTGKDQQSVRTIFGPADGREWWTLDAKNIELRLPAYFAVEQSLIDLFEHPDDPPFYGSKHMLVTSIIFDDLWAKEMGVLTEGFKMAGSPDPSLDASRKISSHIKKKHPKVYHKGKCTGLAMQYQCGEETADRTAGVKGAYKKTNSFFTKLADLNRKCCNQANRLGYVETIPDKKVDPTKGYPLLCRRQFGRVIPTVPLNYGPGQGSAGWAMIRFMNESQEVLDDIKLEEPVFDGYICLTVHDELILDFPSSPKDRDGKPGNLPKAKRIQAAMEAVGEGLGVPLPVSCEYHPKTWADGEAF